MIINICKTCKKEFVKKNNPNRFYKYCSLVCMGKDKDKSLKHSKRMKGKPAWNKGLKGLQIWHNIIGLRPGWNKGMVGIYSQETLEKNRKAHLGKSPKNKGIPMSEEQKKKLSLAHTGRSGALAGNWKGGISSINALIRGSLAMKQWRNITFIKDDYTCQRCNKRGGFLNAHHILNFSDNKDTRFNIDNGITLCRECHKEFHKKYGTRNNTEEQLEKYLIANET